MPKIGLAFVALMSLMPAMLHAQSLPDLPPMPDVSAPLPVGSVPVGDPKAFPETKMDFPIASGPYGPTWESIAAAYPGTPAWLREAKFGIWVHFGPQSAGQSGDWYARRMYQQGTLAYTNHIRDFGHPSEFGYKDLLHAWNPKKLDPAKLVQTYRDAGARFLIIQGVHHDNFDNWNSRYQPWNSVNMGPKRDLLGEWAHAARKAGMRYGVAFHHEYTWWWYNTAFGSDTTGPKAGIPYDGNLTLADGKGKWWEGYDPRLLYTINLREYQGIVTDPMAPAGAPPGGIFTQHQAYAKWYATWWALRIMDVIDKYDPDFVYTDGNSTQPFSGLKSGTGMKSDAMPRVIAHYYNHTLQKRGAVDTFSIVKFHPAANGVVSTTEAGFPKDIRRDQPWIGETPVGDWFYSPGFVYDAGSVIRYLLECVSRDGSTAICISLRPDGSLDNGSRSLLQDVGTWMKINGEGIYGSKAWVKFGEGQMTNGSLRVLPKGKLGKEQAEFQFSSQDFRYTVGKDGSLYAYCMTVPAPGTTITLTSLGTDANLLPTPVHSVVLLGSKAQVAWKQGPDGLTLQCPSAMPFKIAVAFKIN